MGCTRHAAVDRRFEAAVFDWDGTAVADRRSDAGQLRDLVERLCGAGFHAAVVSGTHLGNVDGQLRARPRGPGRLYLLLNRGSEVFFVDETGPHLVERRTASPQEEEALTEAARLTAAALDAYGLATAIVANRLNRRKVDLIPVAELADPPKAKLAQLVAAVEARLAAAGAPTLAATTEIARRMAGLAGLPSARVTTDGKYVEIGLTDKADSARWIQRELWRRGIGPGLVLVAGDELGSLGGVLGSDSFLIVPELARATFVSVGVEHGDLPAPVVRLGGGPAAFLRLLADQADRRARREVPPIDGDPAWTIRLDGAGSVSERAREAMLTLADGCIGSSGSLVVPEIASHPRTLAAGAYAGRGAEQTLLEGPLWDRLEPTRPAGDAWVRTLDLRTGVLRHDRGAPGERWAAALLVSLARPAVAALRFEAPDGGVEATRPLAPPDGAPAVESGTGDGGVAWMTVRGDPARWLAAGDVTSSAARISHDRIAAYAVARGEDPDPGATERRLLRARDDGFERLLLEQREAWAKRWDDADVTVDGDPDLQRAVRFALFHLMASVRSGGEAAVGARGLTGEGYRGHVFWDADVFVLPFLAATHAESARAILEYRARRLDAARRAARSLGLEGARFPWESADEGIDVTPTRARDWTGRMRPVSTGRLEEHIVADVAWAASHYLDWVDDPEFRDGAGRDILLETARYWASRARLDAQGRAHIACVIGPDEYHEAVDDDAFTNGMARWNLRRAARSLDGASDGAARRERGRFLSTAAALVDGYDPSTGLYEQFAGFFGLEPIVVAELAPRRPIAAEVLLGWERVGRAQVVKQPDVLMLHHLLPDDVAPGSLAPNLDYYEPRTAHASSLSPGIHASLFARAGRLGAALEALELTSRIDLDDITATTGGGLHVAAMGSLWQALAFGFLGVRSLAGAALRVDPRLPASWRALEMALVFRGRRVRVRADPEGVELRPEQPLAVVVGDGGAVEVNERGARFVPDGGGWRRV